MHFPGSGEIACLLPEAQSAEALSEVEGEGSGVCIDVR
jgi:hypothetical protein